VSAGGAPLSVVVVSWNSARFLEPCLASLDALRRRPERVVVVDNGSTDASVALVRQRFPHVVRIETGDNLGFCRANNLGIRATASPYVLVLNPDTRLEPDFVEQLLPAFDDPRVGIAAGKLLRFDGRTLDSAGQLLSRSRKVRDRGYGKPDRGQLDRDGPVFGACGAAATYRRTMLDSIAGPNGSYFDERFFAFGEDLDLAWRARRRGWLAVYRHRAVGYHARGGSATRHPRLRRFAALLGRSPEVRFHIVKNRYLAILRNDELGRYLRDAPFIWGRDVATFLLLLRASPGVLGRLWSERALFREVLAERRLDAGGSGHHFDRGRA
jgi:GT2 family glycosyltransferase